MKERNIEGAVRIRQEEHYNFILQDESKKFIKYALDNLECNEENLNKTYESYELKNFWAEDIISDLN